MHYKKKKKKKKKKKQWYCIGEVCTFWWLYEKMVMWRGNKKMGM